MQEKVNDQKPEESKRIRVGYKLAVYFACECGAKIAEMRREVVGAALHAQEMCATCQNCGKTLDLFPDFPKPPMVRRSSAMPAMQAVQRDMKRSMLLGHNGKPFSP